MTMGERIIALRKGRGMTQEQLAERLSVTRQSVSKWELDQATPEIGFAVALCELFGVSLDYLIRGIESEPIAETVSADECLPAPDERKTKQEPQLPTSKPLTAKGYAILFGAIFLLTELLWGNLYTLAVICGVETDFAAFFLFSFAIVVPLPAVYLVTNRWWYIDRRHALRHLWKITAGIAVVGNLFFIGSYEFYCCHVHTGLEYAFWQTDWIMAGYHFLVEEILVMAILLPILVCFRNKKWLCWLAYLLSWVAFLWSGTILDLLTQLIPIGLGQYWGLADVGMYFLIMGVVLLSQVIVHRCLRGDMHALESALRRPMRMWMLGGLAVLCAAATVSVSGGLHYALDLPGLPTVYLPMTYSLIPLLALMLIWGWREENTSAVWRAGALLAAFFVPLMLLGHVGVCYFFMRFYACLGTMPDYSWSNYLLVSAVSALIGCGVALPPMVALRKHRWACIVVAVGVILLTAVATAFLPRVLW